MRKLSIFLFVLVGMNALAQNGSIQAFVIDNSKPYAYLKFDHIGPRKPVQNNEGETGLWLRVVNNCRIPIVLRSNISEDNPGVILEDEVVETEPIMQIYFSAEQEKEAKRRERLRRTKKKPVGYSFEVGGVARVQPGENILFSVPLNHIDFDGDWYMRVKFALDVNSSSNSVGPFTYLSFDRWDVPKDSRPTKAGGPR